MHRSEGWFATLPANMGTYDEFIQEKRTILVTLSAMQKVKSLGYLVLFGELSLWRCGDCTGGSGKCAQRTSNFCKIEKSKTLFSSGYTETNYYIIWVRFNEQLALWKDSLCYLLGEHRYEAFMEFLTTNAYQDWLKYTKREIKELKLKEPTIITARFIGLEEIQKDPWQIFIGNKIKKGDFGCSHYSDLDFLAL